MESSGGNTMLYHQSRLCGVATISTSIRTRSYQPTPRATSMPSQTRFPAVLPWSARYFQRPALFATKRIVAFDSAWCAITASDHTFERRHPK